MKFEDYLHMYNGLARFVGWNPIVREDAPHEKGKRFIPVKINTFPFLISK